MTVTNFNHKINKNQIIAFRKYAERLEATDMTIHRDGTVTLFYHNDCICDRYLPSAKELYM